MPTDPVNTNRTILLFFTISLLVFIIVVFFALYLCRSMFIHRRNSSAGSPHFPPQALDDDDAVGLDPSVVASFPTFTYSWVKNLHAGKYGLECAICLSEFQDDNVLRLLTACSHVFHTQCIDLWLESHTTCPYCRRELRPEEKKSPEVRLVVAEAAAGREVFEEMRGGEEDERLQRRSVSSFKEEGEEGRVGGGAEDAGRRTGDSYRMVRSNSTGHSSLGREDRFTLRLPKDVKERTTRERNWTGSCIDFRDLFGDRDDAREEDREIGRPGLSERGGRSRM